MKEKKKVQQIYSVNSKFLQSLIGFEWSPLNPLQSQKSH